MFVMKSVLFTEKNIVSEQFIFIKWCHIRKVKDVSTNIISIPMQSNTNDIFQACNHTQTVGFHTIFINFGGSLSLLLLTLYMFFQQSLFARIR